jgi:hypothetical protein
MRGAAGAVLLVAALGGCTSVRVVQRDGCWVRRTERFGTVKEDLGPCARPAPAWASDRLTRIVQECVARSDYRWQDRARAAWSRGEPLPPQDPHERVLAECMDEAARSQVAENEALAKRLRDVEEERAALRARTDDDRKHLVASHDKISEYLGEAAKKVDPPATATAYATSDSDSDGRAETAASSPPPGPAPVQQASASGAPDKPAPAAPASRKARARRALAGAAPPAPPACDAARSACAPAPAAAQAPGGETSGAISPIRPAR